MELSSEEKVGLVQEQLPRHFDLRRLSAHGYELTNNKCAIRFLFDRREPAKFVITVANPELADDPGMNLHILMHLFHARMPEGKDPCTSIGNLLATALRPLLDGDFSIRIKHDEIKDTFYDNIRAVLSLPEGSAARRLYDDNDIRWLAEI